MPREFDLEVIDDSGLLALVDVDAYRGFVAEDWEYGQLVRHLEAEMGRGSILVWECGDGGNTYSVKIREGFTQEAGFREAVGGIVVTGDRLHLVSYTALTMVAQFSDYALPEKHEQNLVIPLSRGAHRVRVVQLYDPRNWQEADRQPHFLIEIESGEGRRANEVLWHSA